MMCSKKDIYCNTCNNSDKGAALKESNKRKEIKTSLSACLDDGIQTEGLLNHRRRNLKIKRMASLIRPHSSGFFHEEFMELAGN